MTAIVNNARFSSNRRGNFQCSFSLILIPAYFTPPQCEWQLLPPMWMGALNFVFFFFSFFFFTPWNLMWQSRSRARVVTEAHNKGGGVSFLRGAGRGLQKKKKKGGQESKWEWHLPSAEDCFMPAIDAPFPKVSLQEDRSALQIGSALALFTSGQAGRGHGSHTHPIRHSFHPPSKRPHPPALRSKQPKQICGLIPDSSCPHVGHNRKQRRWAQYCFLCRLKKKYDALEEKHPWNKRHVNKIRLQKTYKTHTHTGGRARACCECTCGTEGVAGLVWEAQKTTCVCHPAVD